ncbi:MAG: peptidoglycan recognition protein family protein [Lachnospiraceae bacterium]|nr:peptidoglycan recognition protein family protein [Lachnospiraceae bacterium]
MGQNEGTANALLEAIKGNSELVKQLAVKVNEKNHDRELVDNCLVAMKNEVTEKELAPEKFYIKANKSYIDAKRMKPKGFFVVVNSLKRTALKFIEDQYNVRYVNDSENLSAHAVIGNRDGKIYQLMPWNYKASYGAEGIGIDSNRLVLVICEKQEEEAYEGYIKKTYDSLATLMGWLSNEYGIVPCDETITVEEHNDGIIDINNFWRRYYPEKDFLEVIEEKMAEGITKEDLMNKYYAR